MRHRMRFCLLLVCISCIISTKLLSQQQPASQPPVAPAKAKPNYINSVAMRNAVAAAVSGTGTPNKVVKWLDSQGVLGDSRIIDTVTGVGIGTLDPKAKLDVVSFGNDGQTAINSTLALIGSGVPNQIPSAINVTLDDQSQGIVYSKQAARVVYSRGIAATGNVSGFDSVITSTALINRNAPYQLRGINIESPITGSGTTLDTFYGVYIGRSVGDGTITDQYAMVTEPGAGNVGIGLLHPKSRLSVGGTIESTNGGFKFPDGSVQTTATILDPLRNNLFLGAASASFNTTGYANTFVGAESGSVLQTTGSGNTFLGWRAGYSNSTSNGNVYVGVQAGRDTDSSDNIFIGQNAGARAHGWRNIFVGSYAGDPSTGNNNIYIANHDNFHAPENESRAMRLGDPVVNPGNLIGITNTYIAGIYNVPIANGVPVVIDSDGHVGTSAASSLRLKEDVRDMAAATTKLFQLRPVTFHYRREYDASPARLLQYGLIAEEVAQVYPELVTYDSDGRASAIKYQYFTPMLLNELQKQHAVISAQEAEIRALKRQSDDLQQRLAEIERRLAGKSE